MNKYIDGYGYDLRFLEACAERANKIWCENELKVFTNMCKSLDLVQVVRCKDCKYRFGCVHFIEIQQDDGDGDMIRCETSPDCYCSWGEKEE